MCLSWLMGKFYFPHSRLRRSWGKIPSLFLLSKELSHSYGESENLVWPPGVGKFHTLLSFSRKISFLGATTRKSSFPCGWQPHGKVHFRVVAPKKVFSVDFQFFHNFASSGRILMIFTFLKMALQFIGSFSLLKECGSKNKGATDEFISIC